MKQFSKKMYAFSLCIMISTNIYSAKILVGDPNAVAGSTFSFNVDKYAFDATNGIFYTGASGVPGVGAESYAIAATQISSGIVAPNAPAQAYINGVLGNNPFYNVVPTTLGLSGTQLLAVATGSITDLYNVTSSPGLSTVTMLKNNTLLDAAGAASSGVVASANQQTLVGTGSVIFAAVRPNGGAFGAANSGIAVYLPAADGSGLVQQASDPALGGVRAVSINTATDALKITTDLVSLNNAIDMHWDATMQRLFVAVQARGAGGMNDGVRGILMGYLTNVGGVPTLNFAPIAASAAFNDSTRIVGGVGGSIVSGIFKVRTMHTSTGLSYLIVNGDTRGFPLENPQPKVFALPLVDKNSSPTDFSWKTDAGHGVLAAVTSGPTVNWTYGQFGQTASQYFYSRTYSTPATAVGHLYANNNVAAMVGGGPAGVDVTDMIVCKDTIFISAEVIADNPEGIYYSQALFNADGTIKGWTVWQRACISESAISGMAYSPTKGNFTFIESTIGRILKSTQWSDGQLDGLLGGTAANSSLGLVAQLKNEFPETNGGIQGLFSFPKTTAGFSQNPTEKLSLGVATGYKKVVIFQSGYDDVGNIFRPQIGDFTVRKLTQTDGALGNPAANGGSIIVSVTGGGLDTLGAITSAIIVNNEGRFSGGYLVVGGVGGIAILSSNTQAGWPTGVLNKNFGGMPTNMQFNFDGNFSNVIKLWTSGAFLYVLTPTSLVRITIDTLRTQPANNIGGTIIATPTGLGLSSFATFSDFVASQTLGVLATSEGLYRVNNGQSITTTTNLAANWVKVALPGGYTPVTRLIPVSATELANDFANTVSGNLYVLNGSVSGQTSALYRFAVNDATAGVNGSTLQLIQDQVLKDVTGPLVYLGAYKNFFYSDGSLLSTTRSKNNTENITLQSLPLSYANMMYIRNSITPIDLGVGAASAINNMVRNPAQGGWLASGSFGLVVNE